MVISEIELSAKNILKIHLDNVNGVRFGHIRIWVRTNSFATLKPSTKGFGFDLKYLDEIDDEQEQIIVKITSDLIIGIIMQVQLMAQLIL